jgi:hypothetical protein
MRENNMLFGRLLYFLAAMLLCSLQGFSQTDMVQSKTGQGEALFAIPGSPVTVRVRNIPGGNPGVPGSLGKVILSAPDTNMVAATLDGLARFDQVPGGGNYQLRVEVTSQSDAFDFPAEWWGDAGPVRVDDRPLTLDFVRNMPYVAGVRAFDGERFARFSALEAGTPLRIHVQLVNPGKETRDVNVLLNLMEIKTGAVIRLEQTIRLPGEGRERVVFNYTPREAGVWLYAPALVMQHEPGVFTDAWSWSSQPLFSVVERHRFLTFGGWQWYVKAGFSHPGPNLWSDSENHVWVDENGALHLTLSPEGNRWLATELVSEDHFGYGTYTFFLKSDPNHYDPHAVAALFLYRDERNEIDIEFTRWGDPDNEHTGNYVLQPAEIPGNQYTFPMELSGSYTTHRIQWKPGKVVFQSWHGNHPEPLPSHLISEWEYTGPNIPQYHNVRLHLNFWLFRGQQPQAGQQMVFVISDFVFQPFTGN